VIHSRELAGIKLFQIVETCGPTHDVGWMFPDLPRVALDANAGWLFPRFWSALTDRHVFAMQLFVLQVGRRVIVIDTGVGNGKRRPASSQTMLNTPVLDWLAAVGAAPDEVTDVVHTHLHADHVGWNTRFDDGAWIPTFVNATHHLPRGDWEHYKARYDKGEQDVMFGSFADSVLPVMGTCKTGLIEGGSSIADVLRVLPAPGHSPGQVALELTAGGHTFIFSGDVLHSPMQVLMPEVNSRWCELPDVARRTRRQLLERAATDGVTLLPAHAAGLGGWRVRAARGGFALSLDGKDAIARAAA
jgi:glyoxylase-like metal-dependent hydrolase (beta-lactamase superfamily II)